MDVGPFPQGDAKDFDCIGSVPWPAYLSDQCPLALGRGEAVTLPCYLQYLLQAPPHRRRHHPSNRHPDPLGWVLRDVLSECVLSWWFSGRTYDVLANSKNENGGSCLRFLAALVSAYVGLVVGMYTAVSGQTRRLRMV